jgi:hypothetical protein
MEKVATVFRRHNGVRDNQTVNIMFDGDILEPDLQVKDAEFIEDHEGDDIICLEVHIR